MNWLWLCLPLAPVAGIAALVYLRVWLDRLTIGCDCRPQEWPYEHAGSGRTQLYFSSAFSSSLLSSAGGFTSESAGGLVGVAAGGGA